MSLEVTALTTHPDTPRNPGADRRSRRDILKTGLIAGGGLWAARMTTPVSRAFAAAPCDAAGCEGTAWAFSQNVKAPTVYPATPAATCPGSCGFDVNLNQPPPPTFLKPVVAKSEEFCACHTFDAGTGACRSEGSIRNVNVQLWKSLFHFGVGGDVVGGFDSDMEISADLLSSFTQVECGGCTVSRDSETKNVRVRDMRTGMFVSVEDAAPNTVIVDSRVLYPGYKIVANEQTCSSDGLWTTAALHVRLPSEVSSRGFGRHIYFGYSAARHAACGACVQEQATQRRALISIP
jgi:hypothetical protein